MCGLFRGIKKSQPELFTGGSAIYVSAFEGAQLFEFFWGSAVKLALLSERFPLCSECPNE